MDKQQCFTKNSTNDLIDLQYEPLYLRIIHKTREFEYNIFRNCRGL
jgi:hypothetical protein